MGNSSMDCRFWEMVLTGGMETLRSLGVASVRGDSSGRLNVGKSSELVAAVMVTEPERVRPSLTA